MANLQRNADGSLAEHHQQRLAALRKAQPSKPTDEDYVALVDACCEQGLGSADIIKELRQIDGCGLIEGLGMLRYYARKSRNPATLERLPGFESIGRS